MSDTGKRILELLASQQKPIKALEIAKTLGFPSARNINPTLYELCRGGQIRKTDSQPPMWLAVENQAFSPSQGASRAEEMQYQGSPASDCVLDIRPTASEFAGDMDSAEEDYLQEDDKSKVFAASVNQDSGESNGRDDMPALEFIPLESTLSQQYKRIKLEHPSDPHSSAMAPEEEDDEETPSDEEDDDSELSSGQEAEQQHFGQHSRDARDGVPGSSLPLPPYMQFASNQRDMTPHHIPKGKPKGASRNGPLGPIQAKIVRFLENCRGQKSLATKIIHGVASGPKKEINRILYSMATSGLVKKIQDSPPIWQLLHSGANKHEAFDDEPMQASAFGNQHFSGGNQQSSVPSLFSLPRNPAPSFSSNLQHVSNEQKNLALPFSSRPRTMGPTGTQSLRPTNRTVNTTFTIPASPATLLQRERAGSQQTVTQPVSSIFDKPEAPHAAEPNAESLVLSITRTANKRSVNTPSFNLKPSTTVPASPRSLLGLAQNSPVPTPPAPSRPVSTNIVGPSSATTLSTDSFAALNKNAISALMEFAQARKTTAKIEVVGQRGPPHNPKFRLAAFVGSRKFPEVESSNKKDGKKDAADMALRMLMAEGEYKAQQETSNALTTALTSGQATHFDRMAALSHQMYNMLAVHVAESMTGKKVMAALVMVREGEGDPGQVISLGTGNRCITGNFMSLEGQTVNDCHAEIITRRGFIRFLYNQLMTHSPDNPQTIFETSDGGRLKVKDSVTFHLYISTAPCGDGALFSPRDHVAQMCCDDSKNQLHDPTFTSKVQGVLRTKMEGGEGTIPIEAGFTAQTWDGILRGERLRTMSCSDKVCRWNLLGLQGALLSHFMEPVYLDSLTLGLLYDHGHLSRAVCCRLSHADPDLTPDLPPGYRVNHPRLGRVTACEAPRETQKTKELSVNWSLGDTRPEVLDGTRGICQGVKTLDEQVSRVSKVSLYRQFQLLCHKFGRTDLLTPGLTYGEAKDAAKDYRTVRGLMEAKFRKLGYGPWVGKPREEKMFT